jgi:hypothetical protein
MIMAAGNPARDACRARTREDGALGSNGFGRRREGHVRVPYLYPRMATLVRPVVDGGKRKCDRIGAV